LKSSDVLKISTSYQDGKLGKGEDYNVEEPGRKKREEQHTVSVGLTTRSKWFPFRVFTEIFILDFVTKLRRRSYGEAEKKEKQPFSSDFLLLSSSRFPLVALHRTQPNPAPTTLLPPLWLWRCRCCFAT
jgi:hypothetical protein